MCGIAGILNLTDLAPPAEGVLRDMLGTLRHRGPDEFGIYLARQVALGNARLSIVDVDGGQQPMSNEDGRYWIVFNGEIFNHHELRAELEARGHRFATRCDTEAIVHLFEDEGPRGFARLNGQFSIALWDARERTLFLARDRVGVRPLFYTRAGGTLVFGSEVKALLAAPEVHAQLDPVALAEVFTYWSAQSPRTCFAGITEVPPGHYLKIREGEWITESYWTLDFAAPKRGAEPGLEASVEELGELLLDAVRLRLRADVPVGAYLSGGLDSSLVSALVRHLGVSRLSTFSIAFSDPHYDESAHQLRMAEFLGTEHQVLHATHAEIARVLPEVIRHTETPLVRTAPVPLFLLSRLVHERGFKVVLTGEGADEFLGGYDLFKETKVRRFWARQPDSKWRPRLLQRLYPDIPALASTGFSQLAAFFGTGLGEVDDPAYSHAIRWRNSRRNLRFLAPALREAAMAPSEAVLRAIPAGLRDWDYLQRAQYFEITTFLSPYLLASQGDRVAMAHSVEGRFPFLDHRVMEFSNRLPSRYKLRGLTEKYLLRRVAERWLPPEISARKKRPYRAPIHRTFLNDETPDYVREALSPELVRATGIFQAPAVTQLLAKLAARPTASEPDEMALVGILSTQVWARQFLQSTPRAEPLGERDKVKVVREAGRGQPATKTG